MTMNEIIRTSERMGLLLFKIAQFKSEDDFKNDKGEFPMLLKTLFGFGCKDLIFEIKNHFLSLGIPEDRLNEYGQGYFDEEEIDYIIKTLKQAGWLED